ncbi:helix-turn-helix domain-containing protein [Streptomyces sp. NPDC026659]|uniref:helix-turn-helix domain-containing protein n=1 Tax=Streptomyces sp. NPDC026659 TaxID=3155123 RepID=UPI0033EDF48C
MVRRFGAPGPVPDGANSHHRTTGAIHHAAPHSKMGGRMTRRQPRQRKPREEREAPPQPTGELMTVEEVARYLGVKVRRVHGWRRRRYLTPVLVLGEIRYMTIEVEHLAAMYGR